MRSNGSDVDRLGEGATSLRTLPTTGTKGLVDDRYMVRTGDQGLLWEGAGWNTGVTLFTATVEAEV